MAKQIKPAKTIQKTTAASPTEASEPALAVNEGGYSTPTFDGNEAEPEEENTAPEPEEGEQPDPDAKQPEEVAPLVVDSRVGPVVMPADEQTPSGLGLVPGKPHEGALPPFPTSLPDGVVLRPGEDLVVRGFRLSDTVVETSEPVYRMFLPPGSKRWSFIMLFPARHRITGAHVKLLSEVESVAV